MKPNISKSSQYSRISHNKCPFTDTAQVSSTLNIQLNTKLEFLNSNSSILDSQDNMEACKHREEAKVILDLAHKVCMGNLLKIILDLTIQVRQEPNNLLVHSMGLNKTIPPQQEVFNHTE